MGSASAAIPEVEANDTPAQATPLAPAGTLLSVAFPPAGGGAVGEGTLDIDDVDTFAFDLASGELVTVLVVSDDGGAVADPTVALIDPSDAEVATDDDSGPGLLPALRRRVATAGTWKVAVRPFDDADAAFDYRVVVSVTAAPPAAPEPLPDTNDTRANADPVPPGGGQLDLSAPGEVAVVTGQVGPGDVDYYEVSLPAGRTLTAMVWDEDAGEFADPVLGIFDDAGNPIGTDDDEGPGFDSAVAATQVPSGAPVFLAVSGYGDAAFDGSHDETIPYELVVAVGPEGAQVCDVDADGDIDAADVNAVFDARGTPASPGDRRDADADGTITALDSRICANRCDEEFCVAPTASACGLIGIELMVPALAAGLWRRRRERNGEESR